MQFLTDHCVVSILLVRICYASFCLWLAADIGGLRLKLLPRHEVSSLEKLHLHIKICQMQKPDTARGLSFVTGGLRGNAGQALRMALGQFSSQPCGSPPLLLLLLLFIGYIPLYAFPIRSDRPLRGAGTMSSHASGQKERQTGRESIAVPSGGIGKLMLGK